MVKTQNAVKKLEAAGAVVEVVGRSVHARFEAHHENVYFFDQDGEVVALHVKSDRDDETTDAQSDYFPGIWDVPSIAMAIRYATHAQGKRVGCVPGCYPVHDHAWVDVGNEHYAYRRCEVCQMFEPLGRRDRLGDDPTPAPRNASDLAGRLAWAVEHPGEAVRIV